MVLDRLTVFARRWNAWIGAVLLVAAVLVAYLPAMRGGFVWGDDVVVTANPLVIDTNGLHAIWFNRAASDYIPVTLTSFWIEWRLWANHAAGYHVVNILLHAGSVILIWRVLRKLEVPGAWLAAVLFAVHPVNVASVAWIAERKNTLSLLFYLLAIFWFLDFQREKHWTRYGLALLAAVCAFLSKESTVILPAVLLGCIWWRQKRVALGDLLSTAPLFALAAVTAMVTIQSQSRIVTPETSGEPLAVRVIRAGNAIWFYLGKDLMPVNLCTFYPKWAIRASDPVAYIPALMVAVVWAIFYIWRRQWSRGLLFGWSYFLVALFPVLGFVNMSFRIQADVADWWQHLAIIGILALVASGAALAWRAGGMLVKSAVATEAVLACALLAGGTWSEAMTYQSFEIHSRRAVERNPDSWAAQENLGTALQTDGNLGEAEEHYRKALSLRPVDFKALCNLGLVLQKEGRSKEAVVELVEALKLNPNDAIVHNDLGLLLQQEGGIDRAIPEFQEALRLDPNNPEAHNNLGLDLQTQGDLTGAVAHYQEALRLRPDFLEAHYNLGRALQAESRITEAIAQYRQVLQLDPNDVETHNNLGLALEAQGMSDPAIAEFREALRLRPDYRIARLNLELALRRRQGH